MSSVGRCPHCGRDEETAHYAQPDLNPRPNNPPPDELATVREQIRQLETREAELRALLLANPDIREGANWLAEIKTVSQARTDLKEMRANHPDIVSEFTFTAEVTRVVLSGITEHGEIISTRKMRSIEP